MLIFFGGSRTLESVVATLSEKTFVLRFQVESLDCSSDEASIARGRKTVSNGLYGMICQLVWTVNTALTASTRIWVGLHTLTTFKGKVAVDVNAGRNKAFRKAGIHANHKSFVKAGWRYILIHSSATPEPLAVTPLATIVVALPLSPTIIGNGGSTCC